jgi:hypothetical protein
LQHIAPPSPLPASRAIHLLFNAEGKAVQPEREVSVETYADDAREGQNLSCA